MCNKFVQGGVVISPQGEALVLMDGPGGIHGAVYRNLRRTSPERE